MGVAHGQATQCEQVQTADERESVDVQRRTPAHLGTVICWGRDRCLGITESRQHVRLTSAPRERTSTRVSLPYFPVWKCPQHLQKRRLINRDNLQLAGWASLYHKGDY